MPSRWRLSKTFTQVLNNKCDLRKPPTGQSYQNSWRMARWAPGFGSAVVFRSRPTSSSRYASATVGTALSQVRPPPPSPSTAGWRIQRTHGLRVLRSKLFTGTLRRPSAVKKKSVTQNRNQRNAHARQIATVLSPEGGRVCQKSAATSCPRSPQRGHVEKLDVFTGEVRKHQRIGLHRRGSGHFKRCQLPCIICCVAREEAAAPPAAALPRPGPGQGMPTGWELVNQSSPLVHYKYSE